ncbi:ATP-dependent DNA helicase UvrD2 [Microlunatus antarcticus]
MFDVPGTDPEELLAGLDPEQREVATALRGPVAVIAGAGTGKTRAITHRIAYGVATGVYRPTSVLAVTFTTRAAGELRGRLQQLGAHGVQARTFHSAALRQLQYFWPRAYGSDVPSVLDNRMSLVAESAGRLRVRVDTARLRDLVSEIGWAKVSNVRPEDYARLAEQHHRSVATIEPDMVARIFTGYEEAKRDRGRIDFEDILLCTAALISDHPDVAEQVRRTYRHLVVDEYQDVSPLQEALLTLWRGDSQEICVVGDPAQTIHSFAGAQPSFLTGFPRRFSDATVVKLVRDYRSTPQVVGCANAVMSVAGASSLKLVAQRPDGPQVSFVESSDEASEASGVAEWVEAQHAAGVEYRDLAVLYRINAQSPPLEQALAERGIPYLVRSGERFYERPEVRQTLVTLRTQLRAAESEGGSALDQFKALLGALGWTEKSPESAGAVRERWESLAALLSVAEDLAAARTAAGLPLTLAEVSAELDRRAEAQHVPVAQGVTVSTLHSAKGLEWEGVALLGVHEGTLPFVLATTPEEVTEERRLLYVGMTRAMSLLRVSWSRTRNGGGNVRKPSRFLDPVLPASYKGSAANGVGSSSAARKGRGRGAVLSVHCRSCGKGLNDAAERKLGRHTDCPSTFDEVTLDLLREWRRQEAASASLPAYCVFTDATLVAIAEARPRSDLDLFRVQGIGKLKVDKYGEQVLSVLAAGEERASAAS